MFCSPRLRGRQFPPIKPAPVTKEGCNMHGVIHPRRGVRLGLTALALAFEMATMAAPRVMAQAQTSPTTSAPTSAAPCGGAMGPVDYPIPGGWFYTEEACA